ncbi:nitrogenase iron-molybdenum cofactor biosynthesis protein NifE [Nostoc sp. FACHB-87]|uniref:nitrogenase iron-molybdenum cofactor biosynthesis protein NifE n=1 Tax=Nostocaceae TaxID=1162 RepID=UPI001688B3B7|nr:MULTISPECIES: nitrogenase iron-molybdenum cofactor biosynthesis protein NifE [Nostocaceae]MBD2458211.1 nitrogenase iron-molybdenum cofactor biosynthesis protein NifE [Nostoc sp. FACHB-87]MBD2480088.1 nitrogenase iron-molybdenum cofactor biosynthesis protein NifE [Anabaena sp. FACHB-83]
MKQTQEQINQLLNEIACEYNLKKLQSKKVKPCKKPPKPGAAQGNCPFEGAMVALGPITDVAHLVHGPVSCTRNPWGSRGSLSSNSQLYQMGFSTDIGENNIIFGGEKKLDKAIKEIAQNYNPAAIFVYATCVTALIGDDIETICKQAAHQVGIPVIYIDAPGFLGSKNLGNRIGGEALFKYVVGTAEPEFTTPFDINIIGDYNVAGEIWNILPLLKKLGIRVLSKITGDAHYQEICYAHRAKLNVVICSNVSLQMAQKMQERYGIPYIEESFYGIENINSCLRNIAAALGDQYLQERTEWLIAEETEALNIVLSFYRSQLQGKRIVLYSGGVKSWSIILAAKDLGMEVVAASDRKNTQDEKVKIKQLLGQNGMVLAKGGPKALLQVIEDTKADILVAGASNQYTALKARIPFLDINHERHHAYAGYIGMLTMAKEFYEALYSPVWEQIRQSAPWD